MIKSQFWSFRFGRGWLRELAARIISGFVLQCGNQKSRIELSHAQEAPAHTLSRKRPRTDGRLLPRRARSRRSPPAHLPTGIAASFSSRLPRAPKRSKSANSTRAGRSKSARISPTWPSRWTTSRPLPRKPRRKGTRSPMDRPPPAAAPSSPSSTRRKVTKSEYFIQRAK